MFLEVYSLVQSHTASTHSTNLDWYLTQMPIASGHGWLDYTSQPPFQGGVAMQVGLTPGKVRLCYLLGHIEFSLFFLPSQELEHCQVPEAPYVSFPILTSSLPPSEVTSYLILQ